MSIERKFKAKKRGGNLKKKNGESLLYFKLKRVRILYLERTLKFIYFMSLQITFLVTLNITVLLEHEDKGENILWQKLVFSVSGHF